MEARLEDEINVQGDTSSVYCQFSSGFEKKDLQGLFRGKKGYIENNN